MHGWETTMLLRHFLEQGVWKSELSRRFDFSRRYRYRTRRRRATNSSMAVRSTLAKASRR